MNEESLFHEALARPDPHARAAFLDRACAGRRDVRAAVEALLSAHGRSGEFLSAPPAVAEGDTVDRAASTDPDSAPPPATITLDRTATAPQGPPPAQLPGRIGRYEIRALLGRGGMGAVYLAHDPELDRAVALKVPLVTGPAGGERFLREARAAAALDHPNLCRVYDAGRTGDVLYLAMAFVPGRTLADVVRKDGPLPPARAAAIAAGIARGMAEAHRHGVVHRDLKPGNVLLDRRGEPVVTDFGLARRAGTDDAPAGANAPTDPDARLTQTGALMGTPAYMPPEQARGEFGTVGPAADVYALGAILFELLTGRPPFRGETVRDTLALIETQPVPPMPGVPAALDAVCRRALAKDPAARFPSMEAFAAALGAFADSHRRRRRARVALLAAAALLLVAGAVIYVKTDHGTIEVRLSDPAADVRVSVDGGEVTLTDGGRVTKLRAGEHELLVKGPDFETTTKRFRVTRGGTTVVEVELTPRKADGQGGSPPPAPDRERLARILERGRKAYDQGRADEVARAADDALKIDPESPTALALRASARGERGDLIGAREDAEAALKLNPETWIALVARAAVSAADDRLGEAIADETVAIRLAPTEPRPWTNRANSYLNRKDYRQAVADATRAIELGQGGPDALLSRAGAFACLGEYDKAAADYDAAAKRAPNDWRVYDQRSALHARLGNAARDEADWKQAKRLKADLRIEDRVVIPDPPKPPQRKALTPVEAALFAAAMRKAEAAFGGNRFAECDAATKQAVELDPTSAAARSLRARLLGATGRTAESVAEANEAIRLDPNDAWAYTTRGAARNRRNEHAAAIADLTVAVRLDPKHAHAWSNRAHSYYQRGQYHQGAADADEALRLKPGYGFAFQNRGACYLGLGEYEKALADYLRAADAQPTHPQPRQICAAILARLGRVEEAEAQRQLAVRIDETLRGAPDIVLPVPRPPVKKDPELPTDTAPNPDRVRLASLLARGRQLIAQGKYAEVGPVADAALRIDPESPGALALRATARAVRNDPAAARADVEAALKLNPEAPRALFMRSYLNADEGKYDDAIADMTVVLRLDPAYRAGWENRAFYYLCLGEYRQAVADADRALALFKDSRSSLKTRAAARAHLGEYEQALADYDAAAALAPNDPQTFLQRSVLHARMGNAEKAAADWETARKLAPTLQPESRPVIFDPPKPPVRKKLTPEEADALAAALKEGETAFKQRRFADCLKECDAAIQIDPTSARPYSLRARAMAMTSRFAQALPAANEAIRLDPTDAWAYAVRGGFKFSQKDYAGAIADHTVALTQDPQLASAWYNRGNAYYRRGNYHQSLADMNEALRLRPDADFYATRAACQLHFGEYQAALADYVRAAESDPKNARYWFFCAVIREKLGDQEGARKDRTRASDLDKKWTDAPPLPLPPPLPPVKTDPELPPDAAPGRE